MKIRLAILENDKRYLERIVEVFSSKFVDKIEVYSFTDCETALTTINDLKIDVVIVSDTFDIDIDKIPNKCGFAYFVENPDIEVINNKKAICKYQKADLIYKQILNLYSENAGNISTHRKKDGNCKVLIFSSPCGGTGTSSMAASCAIHFASVGKKVLYLNLEKLGSSDVFFSGEGDFDMSDIIFALKSKKSNLSIKTESCVKQDITGVNFYSCAKIALDMLELTSDDIEKLINEVQGSGLYNYIIIDYDFEINKETVKLFSKVASIIWIGDGSEISNFKIIRAFTALEALEHVNNTVFTDKISLIYNKFSNKTGKTIGNIGLTSIGGIQRYEHSSSEQVIKQLCTKDVFDSLL